MLLLKIAVAVLATPALLATGYLALLAFASRRPPAPARPPARLRFDVVVPAHDEEAGIARTLRSLLAQDWPSHLFRVTVVADNCTDRTAEVAASSGARVLVRHDAVRRGKGYALDHAFQRGLEDGFAHAFVVVDADTIVTPNLLAAFAARLEAGALAAQAENAVLNREASWRTQLLALAFALFNDVRSLGRDRLRLSCGLRGNGMCVSREALQRVPHSAFSIVEDLEYGLRLGEAGIRIAYACDARVMSEMVSGERASRSQRRRWESGRMNLARLHGMDLLALAVRRRDPVLFDLALDLLVPPLSWIVAYTGVGSSAAAMLSIAHGAFVFALVPWLIALLCVSAYVIRGVLISGMGLRGFLVLAWAPVYVLWKIAVVAAEPSARRTEWVRTARESKAG